VTVIPTREQTTQIVRPSPSGVPGGRAAVRPAGGGITGRDILQIIRKRKLLIILCVVICAAVTATGTLLWQLYAPFYTAEALLEISPPPADVLTGTTGLYGKDIMERLTMTQARLVKSHAVLARATDNDELQRTAWFKHDRREAVRRLREEIDVTHLPNENFVRVSMTGLGRSDGERTELAQIVNAVAVAFVEDSQEAVQLGRGGEMERLRDELDNRESDLDRIHDQLNEARSGEVPNIRELRSVLSIELEYLTRRLMDLRLNQAEARSQLEALDAQEAEGGTAISAQVRAGLEADPALRSLQNFKLNLITERENVLRKFGPQHRSVQNLQTRLDSINKEIAEKEKEVIETQTKALRDMVERALAAITAQLMDVRQKTHEANSNLRELQATIALTEQLEISKKDVEGNISRIKKRLLELRLLYEGERHAMLRSRATKPEERAMPKWGIMMPLGVLAGLLIALGLAFTLEFVDTSIKSPSDISRRIDLPSLGMIPHTDDLEEDIEDLRLAFMTNPNSLIEEAFRQIRTCLLFSGPAPQRRSLLITSPSPEDGRTTVALNLAAPIARSGRRVLVVDANFRQPMIRKLFPETRAEGLSSALVGQANWQELLYAVEPNFDVLAAGPLPPNPAELLGSNQMRQIVAEMVEQYDQVIFDGAPCLVVTDSAMLSTLVDGVILVVRAGTNTYGIVLRTRDTLSRIGAHILGVVLNGIRVTAGGYLRKSYETFYEYREPSQLPAE